MLFDRPITSRDDAVSFIRSLVLAGMGFHLEDRPETIINGHTGERLFSDAECEHVSARVSELYEFLDDPIETLVDIWDSI